MTFSAIAMISLGFGITWGGAAVCIRKAVKHQAKSE